MNSNTPQGTGAMTLDQGVAHIKAKLAERGATADDQVIVHREDTDEESDQAFGGPVGPEDSALDETADGVSADESESPNAEPDDRPVTLPDGTKITVAEARKGYLRQSDFTRKTTDLAREREALAAREQATMRELGGLYQQLASLQEAEPNWQALAGRLAPAEYQRLQATWRQNAAQRAQVRQALDQANRRTAAAQRQRLWESLSTGTFDPGWKDRDTLSRALDSVTQYLVDRGVPHDLVGSIEIPAVIEIAEESRRYRELQNAKPKAALAVRGKPAPFRPGTKSGASPAAENIRLLNEAFLKNPTIDNAAALESARAAARRR